MMKAEPAGSNQETLGETELVKRMWAQDGVILSTQREGDRKVQDSEEREKWERQADSIAQIQQRNQSWTP